MSVTFVIGRAGSGKTHYCLERVASQLAATGDDRAILLVPEQASFQMERALAQRTIAGGYWRADVLSFTRLARRVAAELGIATEPMSADARHFGLRFVLSQLEPRLSVLRDVVTKSGFVAEMAGLIEEWLTERITPDEIRSAALAISDRSRAARLTELALVFEEYCAWIRRGAPDPAQRLDALRDQLTRVEWLRSAHIFVDGFAGFTGQELATLVALARGASSMTITLLMTPREPVLHHPNAAVDPLRLFSRVAETYRHLARVLGEAGVAIRAPVLLEQALATSPEGNAPFREHETALAAMWDRPGRLPVLAEKPIGAVRVVACATPRDELRMVAGEIRRAVADSVGRVRFRDCAVITREIEPIAELCREVFSEFEIPHFLDQRRTLRAHPLTALVRHIWDAVRSDFATEPMLALVRTGLLPLDAHDAEQLQSMAAVHRPRGAEGWLNDWPELSTTPRVGRELRLIRERIIHSLRPLHLAMVEESVNGRTWSELFYGAVHALGICEKLTTWIKQAVSDGAREKAEVHRLGWAALVTALEQLHAWLGDTPLRGEEAASLLVQSLAGATVGLTPPGLDQVLVSAIERSRHPDISHAWLIGFNEGAFPRRLSPPALLTHADRAALRRAGLDSIRIPEEDSFAERLLAYIAMTRPQRSLTISYSNFGLDGDERLPSPFLADVRRALGAGETRYDATAAPPACTAELARRILADAADPRVAYIDAQLRSDPRKSETLDFMLRGRAYRNRTESLGELLPTRTAPRAFKCSVSEVESYLQCPFRYFARHALSLNPHRGPPPLHLEFGDAAHAVLANVTRSAIATGSVATTDDQQWLTWFDHAATAVRTSLEPDLARRRPQAAYLYELLLERLRDVVLVHAERWRRGDFVPLAVEISLEQAAQLLSSPGQSFARLAPIALDSGDMLLLNGRIDRLDQTTANGRTALAIYDYKQRATSLRTTPLVSAALQAFAYAAALRAAGGHVCGALIAPLAISTSTMKLKGFESLDAATQRMHLLRPRGLIEASWLSQFDRGLKPSGQSPVVAVQLTSKGAPYKGRCDTTDTGAIAARCEAASSSIALAGAGIARGKIEVSPLVFNRKLACLNCDYKPVCRFERGLNDIRNAQRVLPAVDDESQEEALDETSE